MSPNTAPDGARHHRSRWRRGALGVLAGLTIASALGTVAQAAGGSSVDAAAEPEPPKTEILACVNDVQGQFDSLKHHPESMGFRLGNGAGDPSMPKHYQGISRVGGGDTPHMVLSRNGNPAPYARPAGASFEPGELIIVEMGSRDTSGERMRSSRMVPGQDINDTPPPAEDRVINAIKFDGSGEWPAYRHLGGMQTVGDIAIVGADGQWNGNSVTGMILLVDLKDPANPHKLAQFELLHKASWVSVGYIGNRPILLTSGHNGDPIYVYEFSNSNLRTDGLELNKIDEWHKSEDAGGSNYPGSYDSYQTANLYRDCATGETYLLATYYDSPNGPLPTGGEDYMDMWKVDLVGNQFQMERIRKRQLTCNRWGYDQRDCHFVAAGGFHVTPAGELLLYGAEHENGGPGGSVRFGEFAHQGGYRPGSSNFNPTAVPGSYAGAEGATIRLDGTASVGAYAQAWIDMYDQKRFGGHSLVIDHRDRDKEDLADFSRAEDFNDEASSVRWIAPVDCQIVLFEDRNFRKNPQFLTGNGGFQQISDLGRFDEKASSMLFEGNTCDGRITSWRWDVGADGNVDAEGPNPTITLTGSGEQPVSLEVCTGWNTCHTTTGTITVEGTASFPETTATVAGTAGDNGWHRGPVTVTLTATGNPAPTEIVYSATGAEPIGTRTVAGTSTSFVIDNQGTTTVTFFARNADGSEQAKTLNVKIDSIAPSVAIDSAVEGASYTQGFQWAVGATCADGNGSGLAGCTTSTAMLDTATPGDKTLIATARDNAGNVATAEVHYTVLDHAGGTGELVFVAGGHGSGYGDIMRSNLDGTNLVRLREDGGDPSWSPDGSRIAFRETDAQNTRQVFLMDPDGTDVVQLTFDAANPAYSAPTWSPDGSTIVYTTSHTVNTPTESIVTQSIRTVPAAGGSPTTVIESTESRFADPAFTPDGASIVYVESNSILRSIPVSSATGDDPLGDVLTYSQSIESIYRPTWSPDGTKLAFLVADRETSEGDIWTLTPGAAPVNLTGTDSTWPTQGGMTLPTEDEPTWLPDGRLAFELDDNLWAMAPEPLAPATLLVDLPDIIRHPDVLGA